MAASCSDDDKKNVIDTGTVAVQVGSVGTAIDLGLSVKWADHNVGASSPTESGNYYGWSDATGKNTSINVSDYSMGNILTTEELFEANKGEMDAEARRDTIVVATYEPNDWIDPESLESGQFVYTDNNAKTHVATISITYAYSGKGGSVCPYQIAGDPQYDPAALGWGAGWRMPTPDEIRELITECTWKAETQSGVSGYTVTGPNGNSIFLPLCGYRIGAEIREAGNAGFYWSGCYEGTYAFPSAASQLAGGTGSISSNTNPSGLFMSPQQQPIVTAGFFYGPALGQTVRSVQ